MGYAKPAQQMMLRILLAFISVASVSCTLVDTMHQHLVNFVDNGTPLPPQMVIVGYRSGPEAMANEINSHKTIIWTERPNLSEDFGKGVYLTPGREEWHRYEKDPDMWHCLIAAFGQRYFQIHKAWIPLYADPGFAHVDPSDLNEDGEVELIYNKNLQNEFITRKYRIHPDFTIRLAMLDDVDETGEDETYQMVIPPRLLNAAWDDGGLQFVAVCRPRPSMLPNIKVDWDHMPRTHGSPDRICE